MGNRRTKIVATISPQTVRQIKRCKPPASLRPTDVGDVLRMLTEAGVDVFRLNMSFRKKMGDEFIESVFKWFREHENDEARMVTVLADLQGPKLRLGELSKENTDKDKGRVELVKGQEYCLYYTEDSNEDVSVSTIGDANRAVVLLDETLYRSLGDRVREGIRKRGSAEIAVGDGRPVLRVEKIEDVKDTHLVCRVEVGGVIESGKGVMPKQIPVDVRRTITEQDAKDVKFLLKVGGQFLSYFALSFVKGPRDILELRRIIDKDRPYQIQVNKRIVELATSGDRKDRRDILRQTLAPGIIAKIETVEAVDEATLNSIVDVADAVMVARGDLALQMDLQDVPREQKKIIELCRLRGKPVITATQMLHTMQNEPHPTRSEANDVFNAVLDGTDATMLSGETSTGEYPLEAVKTMALILATAEDFYQERRCNHAAEWAEMSESLKKIIESTESRLNMKEHELLTSARTDKDLQKLIRRTYAEKKEKTYRQPITDMICMSAWAMIASHEVAAVIAATTSGRTARMLARYRPHVPIFGATHDDENRRKLILSYGIYPVDIGLKARTTEQLYDAAINELRAKGCLKVLPKPTSEAELVLTVSGTPLGDPGSTNQIRLISLDELKPPLCM